MIFAVLLKFQTPIKYYFFEFIFKFFSFISSKDVYNDLCIKFPRLFVEPKYYFVDILLKKAKKT